MWEALEFALDSVLEVLVPHEPLAPLWVAQFAANYRLQVTVIGQATNA